MKKTLLFPTDFSIESLALVKEALPRLDSTFSYNIILLYGQLGSDGITEMLFQTRSKQLADLCSPAFEEALAILKNKYGSLIQNIRKDIVSDYGQRALNNYLEANKVDFAFVPENDAFIPSRRNSLNLVPMLIKSKVEVVQLEVENMSYNVERGKLAALFANTVSAN